MCNWILKEKSWWMELNGGFVEQRLNYQNICLSLIYPVLSLTFKQMHFRWHLYSFTLVHALYFEVFHIVQFYWKVMLVNARLNKWDLDFTAWVEWEFVNRCVGIGLKNCSHLLKFTIIVSVFSFLKTPRRFLQHFKVTHGEESTYTYYFLSDALL